MSDSTNADLASTDESAKAPAGPVQAPDEASVPPAPPAAAKPETKPRSRSRKAAEPEARFEEYEVERPDGEVVTVRRNIETGASEIVDG